MEALYCTPLPRGNTHLGVVLGDRYARNPSGKLSHSRKELLVRPIRQELFADIVSKCPEQLWLVDKSPDVLLWSAKARKWVVCFCGPSPRLLVFVVVWNSINDRQAEDIMLEMNSRLAGNTTDTSDATQESEPADVALSIVAPAAAAVAAAALGDLQAVAALPEPPAPQPADATLEPTQKDFSIALGISQARVSQLVKGGMPLRSFAAAKEWRMKQRDSDGEGALGVEPVVPPPPKIEQSNELMPAAQPPASPCAQDQSQPLTTINSPAASHPQDILSEVPAPCSKDSVSELIASKKTVTREHLESLTTLNLRSLCQSRSLKVCGYKNDLVFRLLYFFANDSRSREQLDALSVGDLQRICRNQGLSHSGTKDDLVLRLMDSSTGTTEKQDSASEADNAQQPDRHPPPTSDSSSTSRKRAAPSSLESKAPTLASSTPANTPPAPPPAAAAVAAAAAATVAAAVAAAVDTASTRAASSSASSLPTTPHLGILRIIPKASSRPSFSATASSIPRDLDQVSRKRAAPEQPAVPKTTPRPQHASLELHFPVPTDAVAPATPPILFNTDSSPADAGAVTLIQNRALSPAQPFPPFVLPPPPRSFTQAAFNQRPPPGMGLSSCVVLQRAHHHSSLSERSSCNNFSDTFSAYPVSQRARASCAEFLCRKAAGRIT